MFAVDVEAVWVWEIGPLPFETDPLVEAGFGRVGFGAHVPFAEEAGFVADFLQIGREEDGAFGDGRIVIDDAVTMGVDAGEDGGTTGAAERGSDEGVLEVHTFVGEAVELRSFEPGLGFHETEGVVTMIVAKDEDDVARLGGGACGEGGTGGKSSQHLAAIHNVYLNMAVVT